MSLNYTLVRQEEAPSRPQPGWIWVKQSVGTAYLSVQNDWRPIVDGVTTTQPNGGYWYSVAVQGNEPSNNVGKLWLDTDTNQMYIYLGGWIPLIGG